MTEQEIMQLARDAGFSTAVRHTEEDIVRFATLVAEREREACARVCDELEEHYSDYAATALLNGDIDLSNAASGEPRAARAIAAAIRARGGKENNHG